MDEFNEGKAEANQVEQYKLEDLNKIAFWSATGSGKTLLMHVNILQFKHYLKKHGKERDLNRIILLTPNEGLSLQHLDEFEQSNMVADLFSKDGSPSLFSGKDIEIIDIHKLRDESGDKTVAVEAFEGTDRAIRRAGRLGGAGSVVIKVAKRGHDMRFDIPVVGTRTLKSLRRARCRVMVMEAGRCILLEREKVIRQANAAGISLVVRDMDVG